MSDSRFLSQSMQKGAAVNLILMRHGERKHDAPEQSAGLTDKAIEKTRAIAIELAEEGWVPDNVLSSTRNPTIATAKLLRKDSPEPVQLELLNPPKNEDDTDHYYPKWPDISKRLALSPTSTTPTCINDRTIAIVGHHPGITNLLESVTGEKCRRIGRGEAILVTGSPEEIKNKRGTVAKTFGTESAPEGLRKKIELKMTVCTFLAGFTIPVLVELLKSEPEDMLKVWCITSIIAFTFSFALLVAGVIAFDLLLMPTEYWGAINPESKPKFRRWSKFSRDYRLSGVLYAYMVQTWRYFFGWGLGFIVVGFASLLLKGVLEKLTQPDPKLALRILGGGASLVLLLTFALYRWLRPRLGIVD